MSEIKLNENQLKAVTHDGGPLLIIAGAGTGKTTVVTERIKWLIQEKNIKPEQILALTFTEKAAQEMEERVDVALPFGYTQTWILTFHGFCERVLRAESVHIGLDPGFNIMSEPETQLFINDNLFKFDLKYFRPQGNPGKFLSGLITHFSRLQDDDVLPNEYVAWVDSLEPNEDRSEEDIEKFKELANAYKMYEQLKIENSVMDFADLISKTLVLFRKRKNVLAEYQKKFPYILVDEFQDTNFAQNQLARMLAKESQNITVVADDDQSIYRWRGAAVYNVLDFQKHFKNATFITLTDNYRSSQNILDASYALIQHNNPDRLEPQAGIDKKLVSNIQNQESKINVIWEETVENESEQTVSQIVETMNSNPELNYSDIAILVRANAHAEPFTRAMSRAGIPYQFLGPGRLFKQAEVKDLIAYCRLLVDPADNVSLYRVLSSPMIMASGKDIQWIVSAAKKTNVPMLKIIEDEFLTKDTGQPSLFSDALPLREEENSSLSNVSSQKMSWFIDMVHRHMELMKTHSPGEVLYAFLEDTGELEKMHDPQSEFEQNRVENISAFFNRIKVYEVGHPEAHLFDFVTYLNFMIGAGESPLASQIDWAENNAVKIITVHSAKGLEFDTVFVVNAVDKRFPTVNRRDQIPVPEEMIKEPSPVNDPHIAEERRLFYVALTRAKRNLFITGSKFYHDSETARAKKMSPFITEALGEDVTKFLVQPQQNRKAIDTVEDFDIVEEIVAIDNVEGGVQDLIRKPVTYLSYSQIETFETCPLHYKLGYILKIPTLPNGALTFGTTVHNTLRDVYVRIKDTGEKRMSPELWMEVERIYNSHWSPVGFETKEHEHSRYEDGKKLLRQFIEEDIVRDYSLVTIEEPFTFKLLQNLRLGGRIDRIQRLPDGTLEIIDYKTGKMPEMRELTKGLKGLQLSIYALAAKEVLHEPLENVRLSFYYLESGDRVTIERSEEDLKNAQEKILEVKQKIETSDLLCGNSYICQQGCEYDLFCGE